MHPYRSQNPHVRVATQIVLPGANERSVSIGKDIELGICAPLRIFADYGYGIRRSSSHLSKNIVKEISHESVTLAIRE
jgi:hypothetical protein